MNFTLTEEQQAVSDLATQIIGDHSDPAVLRELELSGEARFDRSLWSALAEAGLLGISLPERVGGAGLGLIEAALVIRAASHAAAAAPVWETLGLGAAVLAPHAGDDTVSSWLGRCASGEAVLTGAWHETAGDPCDPHEVTASRAGDGWELNGTKIIVPAGLIADAAVVVAHTDGGAALFLVDLSTVERVAVHTTAGTPDANLTFDSTPAVLVAEGADAVRAAYNRAVATQCAAALGTGEAALQITANYTKERKQFEVPIASFQAVGHRVADTYIDVESIRLTTWQALWLLDDGRDATIEVAAAQYFAAHAGHRISLASAHLHGGVGGDRDYPLHRHFLAEKQNELHLGGATAALRRMGKAIAANI